MSVRSFWLAGDGEHGIGFTAETTQDALDPSGIVRQDNESTPLVPGSLNGGLVQATRAAALCNVATSVLHFLSSRFYFVF